MRVHVSLRGTLADRLPGGSGELDLADDATVAAVSDALGLPGRHCVFVVNGQTVKLDSPLREDDRVQAFSAIAGGAGLVAAPRA